jgi:DNA polymerase-3 subunit beta
MKIVIERDNLISALKDAVEVSESRTTMPVLQHVLIQANGSFSVCATDLEISLAKEVDAQIEKKGSICLPARKLLQIVKELEEAEITLEEQNNSWIKLECGKTQFRIAGLSSEDFPQIELEHTSESSIPAQNLISALIRVVYASTKDECRRCLNGVYMYSGELVATDGHRLAKVTVPELRVPEGIILSRKGVQTLTKLFDEEENSIQWARQGNHITFSSSSISVSITLVDGDYPNYKSITQNLSGTSIYLSLCNFRSQLDMAKAVGAQQVVLMGKDKVLEIIAKSKEQEGEMTGAIDVIEGSWEGEIGFNIQYLLEPLSIGKDEYTVELMLKPDSPCSIKFNEDPSFLYVVMPMKI